MLNLSFLVRLATGINCNFIVYKNYKFWWLVRIKDGIAIWAKLKQGNGRGTCCWSTHIIKNNNKKLLKTIIKISALRGYLDIKRLMTAEVNNYI